MKLSKMSGVLAGAAVAAAALMPSASAATASTATPTANALAAARAWVTANETTQLAHNHGGVVNGNTISYPKDGVTVTFEPKVAGVARPAFTYHGCSTGQFCLYSDNNQGSIVLESTSVWCGSKESGNGYLTIVKYPMIGNVHSADSENGLTVRMLWYDPAWGVGNTQWTLSPHGDLYSQSSQNNLEVMACANPSNLTGAF